jgi:hypothetical protein
VASSLLGVTFISWLAWAAWFHADPAINASLTSYEVVSDHEARAKVAARFRDADVDGSCLLRATARDHTVVGELNVTADELRRDRGDWISVRTEREATSVTLVSCRESGN